MQASQRRATTSQQLFHQDIVQKVANPDLYGVVSRSWHDVEDSQPIEAPEDPFMRALAYGEVGVTFVSHGGEREILPESDLCLLDRILRPGDYCKKSFDDVQAGVIASVKVKARVAHAISGVQVDGWFTVEDFQERADADIGDYVVFDDWLGQIIEVFDEAIVQVPSGDHLVRLPELGSRLVVGETGNDILPRDPSQDPSLSSQNAAGKEMVIAVKHNTYAITWLALNQMLDPAIAEKKMRPMRFWSGEDIGKLTLFRPHFEKEIQFGDRLYLKNTSGVPVTKHGQPADPTGEVYVQTVMVSETSTELEVLWQDGSRETVRSVDVIPYLNTDEYDCWPGDHVLWKSEQGARPAIVQSVNAVDRTSLILFPDTGTTELASLLELDTVGNTEHAADLNPEAFGVQRGDIVFINAPGSISSTKKPHVPRIGEIEPWVHDEPYNKGHLQGWRKELFDIGSAIASKRNVEQFVEKTVQLPVKNSGDLTWIGEVHTLNLDGTVEVRHPDDTVGNYAVEHLTLLYDGIEQLEAAAWNGSDGYHTHEEDLGHEWDMDMDDNYSQYPNEEWSTSTDWQGVQNNSHAYEDETDSMEVDDTESSPSEYMSVEEILIAPDIQAEAAVVSHPVSEESSEPLGGVVNVTAHTPNEIEWNRFEILPSAPPDHAFFSSAHAQPSKAFLGRLSKEYRILRDSLPDSILVRAYEDRTDLLRSLIIGPENTPYQDAPFVIDWMLDSNFPNSPPIAHFLSWTNGNGRVNPNLYEEGKVCLSILGTWTGDKHEVWNASRSSLLQALVSIQGLVLVKEPWFCEPAYDKLRGTKEGTINSRLYSEKAYVLSRGFVRRALEIPLGGLEAEIAQLYYGGGRLQKVINDAQMLISTSKNNPEVSVEEHDLAVPRLSAGGIIALERTLSRLRVLNSDISRPTGTHPQTL